MTVKHPPKIVSFAEIVKDGVEDKANRLSNLMSYHRVTDDKGRYHHWDDFQYRVEKGVDAVHAWSVQKMARLAHIHHINYQDKSGERAKINVLPSMHKACSLIDQQASKAAFEAMISNMEGVKYLIRELREEESISSSQLEGAATTTIVAKAMLSAQRKPRTEDERMILGNYRLMGSVWDKRNEELSLALIKEFHAIGTKDINNEKYKPGVFRDTDNIVICDYDGNVVHYPPSHDELDSRLLKICEWANTRHEDLVTSNYLHPLIKACILHFMVGYEHPFNDGNGRTARALFYWYLFKCGYTAFKYISISRLLKEASVAYGKSYLFTETDGFDLTYFVDYQCQIVCRATLNFTDHIKKIATQRAEIDSLLWTGGLINRLNDRQRTILLVAIENVGRFFTAKEVSENLNISDNTARADLKHLVEIGLFEKIESGKQTIYVSPKSLKGILEKLKNI
ncbi:Fic family protein [Klebsiella oxytoca]|uniref:Fic family protein n=1 Tax=Klebsiella oxytoca TaxID=571 RepID=UPI00265D9F32|nr:Fic family protein [Klebsiella oxytoca]WKM73472.1 Fic family protein [Klebsiella oxytoca]